MDNYEFINYLFPLVFQEKYGGFVRPAAVQVEKNNIYQKILLLKLQLILHVLIPNLNIMIDQVGDFPEEDLDFSDGEM